MTPRDDITPEEAQELRHQAMRDAIRRTKDELRRLQGKPVVEDDPEGDG